VLKVIFLDVDGVLNSTDYHMYSVKALKTKGYTNFDPRCLHYLKVLVEITKCKMALSSSWRKSDRHRDMLQEELAKLEIDYYFIGCTPGSADGKRGGEIKEFLARYPQIKECVIIDDEISDMGEMLPRVLKTDRKVGLTKENVLSAIKLLKQEDIAEDELQQVLQKATKKLNVLHLLELDEKIKEFNINKKNKVTTETSSI